jgi:hypothetical protein
LCAFLWAKGLSAKDIHKELFPLYGVKRLSRKAVHNWVEKFFRDVGKPQMMPDQVQKWLRQQSKDCFLRRNVPPSWPKREHHNLQMEELPPKHYVISHYDWFLSYKERIKPN